MNPDNTPNNALTCDSAEECQRQVEEISRRAYYLWEAAGRPEGRDDDFWFAAEAEFGAGRKV